MIHIGRRTVRHKRGYVPMICTVCHGLRAAMLVESRSHMHINLIPVSRSHHDGTQLICQDCGVPEFHPPVAFPQKPIKGRKPPEITALVHGSWPEFYEDAGVVARLRLHEDLIHGRRLNDEQRRTLLLETLATLSGWSAAFKAEGSFDNTTLLSLLGGLVGAGVLAVLTLPHIPESLPYYTAVITAAVIGFLVLAFLPLFLALRNADIRWVRKKFLPIVARALRPLLPSEREVRLCVFSLTFAVPSPLVSFLEGPGTSELLNMIENPGGRLMLAGGGTRIAQGAVQSGNSEEILLNGKPLRRR